MIDLETALAALHAQAQPDKLAAMRGFGLQGRTRLGVAVPVLRRLAREWGKDHGLALALWHTGIPEAQILAALVADPAALSVDQMDGWARSSLSWDVCDQACLNAFVRSPRAWGRVPVWAADADEWVRRAAFSLLACLAVHDKRAEDARFEACFALIETASDDGRNFVKKSVNWSLRQIGKRNAQLRPQAIACAQRVAARGSSAARWIAADALRELV